MNITTNKEKYITNKIFGDFLKNSGSRDMNNDYSSTSTDFEYITTQKTLIKNILMYMESSNQIHYEYFGSLVELTNGLRFWYKLNGSSDKIYMDSGFPIKTNGDFAKISFDVNIKQKSSGNNVFVGQLDFKEGFGEYLLLESGGSIGITLNDNISGLDEFTMFIKGKTEYIT